MIHASVSGTPVASGCEFHVSVFDIFWCLRAFIIVTSGTKWLNILLVVFCCVFVVCLFVCFCCRLFLFLSNTASISLSVQDQKPALTTAGDRWGTLWCPDCDGSSSEALLNWRIPPTPQCLPPLMWGLPSLTFYADSTDYKPCSPPHPHLPTVYTIRSLQITDGWWQLCSNPACTENIWAQSISRWKPGLLSLLLYSYVLCLCRWGLGRGGGEGGWRLVAWWVCLGGMYVQCLVAQSFIREVCVCVW